MSAFEPTMSAEEISAQPEHVIVLTEADNLRAEVERLRAEVLRLSSDIDDVNDYRLLPIWQKAGECADSRGYCSVFDEVLNDMGVTTYAREVDVCVTVTQTITYDIHVRVPKNDLYESTVRDAVEYEFGNRYTNLSETEATQADIGEWSIDDWSVSD